MHEGACEQKSNPEAIKAEELDILFAQPGVHWQQNLTGRS